MRRERPFSAETSQNVPTIRCCGPAGFQEEQMRSYFEQFGKVLHVRLSRSKKVDLGRIAMRKCSTVGSRSPPPLYRRHARVGTPSSSLPTRMWPKLLRRP